MGGDYPSKPMSLYATIWDGSTWATSGGRYKVNYRYAPFASEFAGLVLHGCSANPIQQTPSSDKCHDVSNADYATITPERRLAMNSFRRGYMIYSYCYDIFRYPVPPPECVIIPSDMRRYKDSGHLKFGRHRRHRRSKRRTTSSNDQAGTAM